MVLALVEDGGGYDNEGSGGNESNDDCNYICNKKIKGKTGM